MYPRFGGPICVGGFTNPMERGMPQAGSPDHELLAQLLHEVRELREQFSDKIRYDEVRERQVADMQQELEAHRQGLYLRMLGPLVKDLIAIHDDLTQAMRDTPGGDETPGALAATLASVRDSVLEALHRNGVTDFSVDGDTVDRTRQRVIKVEETGDAAADRRLARRLRPGFELDGKVLRPEWVVAYRYATAPVDATQ